MEDKIIYRKELCNTIWGKINTRKERFGFDHEMMDYPSCKLEIMFGVHKKNQGRVQGDEKLKMKQSKQEKRKPK